MSLLSALLVEERGILTDHREEVIRLVLMHRMANLCLSQGLSVDTFIRKIVETEGIQNCHQKSSLSRKSAPKLWTNAQLVTYISRGLRNRLGSSKRLTSGFPKGFLSPGCRARRSEWKWASDVTKSCYFSWETMEMASN